MKKRDLNKGARGYEKEVDTLHRINLIVIFAGGVLLGSATEVGQQSDL